MDPPVRGGGDGSRSLQSQHHQPYYVSTSSGSLNSYPGASPYPMSRSSSGMSLRQDPTVSQGLEPYPGSSYIHRSSRANSDVIRRSNSPSSAVSHQRQTSGSGLQRFQKLRNTSGNTNRNNSTRMSPNLQRRVFEPNDLAAHQMNNNNGRGSPMMGQRYLGTVAVDEHAGPMLQRVATNWSHDDRHVASRQRVIDDRDQHLLVPGSSHYGSMSSLASSGPAYHPHVSHQRNRGGRSLDGADPNYTPYGLLAASGNGRDSPIRRVQTMTDKTGFTQNGRNSPQVRSGGSFHGQSSSSMRQRHPVPMQLQQAHLGKKPGTSFSSSFH